jgi:ERCC4-type nuclease
MASATTSSWVKIIIDSREHALIDLIHSSYPEFKFEISTLPLGDIQILGSRGQNFLLERKTYQDLAGSLADGRFKNQKDRLIKAIQENPSVSIAYILEGHSLGPDQIKVDKHGRITNGQLRSLIVSMTLKSRIPIIPSSSLTETFMFIQRISKKILDDIDFVSIPVSFTGGFVEISEIDKVTPAFLSKKDTSTKDSFGIQCKMLTCISGMSITRAEAIISRITENGYTLFTIGTLTEEELRKLLIDIKISGKRIPGTILEEWIRVIRESKSP